MLDGGLVAFAGAAGRLLPAPAEAVQQAANMIAIIAHPEAAPNQIRHSLRGPDRRRESVSLGSLREQARKLRESSAGQFRRASGAWAAGCKPASPFRCPCWAQTNTAWRLTPSCRAIVASESQRWKREVAASRRASIALASRRGRTEMSAISRLYH